MPDVSAAKSTAIDAVVSEGAGERVGEVDDSGATRLLSGPAMAVMTGAVTLLGNTGPQPPIVDRIGLIQPRSVFLIYADPGIGGEATRQPLLRSRRRAEGDLARARLEAHRRPRSAAGRVRATRRRVLRPGPPRAVVSATASQAASSRPVDGLRSGELDESRRLVDETLIARIALGLLALHVVDDSWLQPQPGTSAGDHLVSGLVPLAVIATAAWAYPRLRAGLEAVLALFFGIFGITLGIEAGYYTTKGGPSGDDFTGFLALGAGIVLLGLGFVTLWRSRKGGRRSWRYTRRALLAVAGLAVVYVVVFPLSLAYVLTHVARGFVPEPELGAAFEEVSFTTSDGLELRGWYVPSKNRAAVIAFPGRSGPQRPARMLAAHGYGVLLFDRRGEGESEGDPNVFGWKGERDVRAAVEFLRSRPDVEPQRIGGIGLSVGGEMMIEAAAESGGPSALVSEGAGIRSIREALAIPDTRKKIEASIVHGIVTPAVALFSNSMPPASLEDLSGRIAPTPVFFVYAVPGQGGEAELNETFYEAAREPKEIWLVPGAGHTGGIEAQPDEYERRVVGFFDRALLGQEP